jgi:hypothetical protein
MSDRLRENHVGSNHSASPDFARLQPKMLKKSTELHKHVERVMITTKIMYNHVA